MAEKIEDGGPAFPGQFTTYHEHVPAAGANSHSFGRPVMTPQPGMTLRDYFAIHAPADEIEKMRKEVPNISIHPPCSVEGYARLFSVLRYQYADAMLEASRRGKR